ncbi:hypothetical protein HanXRQr2_Chr06g0268871 [Helianthus annuus]|uniref:Uncharacterized protein n=1 Tax=Helianthus annuus TaxID=4232 RepID=A0A9K3IUB2_HELAN|nr:hypothetical protein HanXRQr2_Chr06g0268871 [Helianthus annuus]KAJ0916248.1 hypothetical protein HanPSC8_Chr06g0259481 [Helianthus annuus]
MLRSSSTLEYLLFEFVEVLEAILSDQPVISPISVVRYSWSLHREARSLWDMAVCAMLKTLHYFILNTYIGFYNYASAKHLTTYLIWNTFHIVRLNFTYYLLCSI